MFTIFFNVISNFYLQKLNTTLQVIFNFQLPQQVYSYLFRRLRKCILQVSPPTVEGPLGTPPFERPSIFKGVTNFVLHKFNHLQQKVSTVQVWQLIFFFFFSICQLIKSLIDFNVLMVLVSFSLLSFSCFKVSFFTTLLLSFQDEGIILALHEYVWCFLFAKFDI